MIVLETDIKKSPKKLPRVLTSFTWDGYQKYGKRFLETWLEFWPRSISLTVYYEGQEFENFDFTPGISWAPIEMVEFLPDFLGNLRFPIQHGIVGDRYDINYDARMGRKAFMQSHHARKYGGKVFWMDADAVSYRHVPEAFLDLQLPDDKFSCYLGREGWYFTESGFIGFNYDHPIAKEFFRNYVHMFITGVIFSQAPQYSNSGGLLAGGWHDCVAYDCTRFLANAAGHEGEFVNLASHVPHGTMHPHANSEIGKYVKHLKGDRKETGDLKEGDLVEVGRLQAG